MEWVLTYPSPAGNDGELGAWYASAPATGLDVISVGSVDKFVAGPSLWALAKYLINSIIMPVQNATVLVNGKEVAPIVSLWFCCMPQPLTWISAIFQRNTPHRHNHPTQDLCNLD